MLHVPRVEFPDYPGCECLRIVSKDELKSAFCKRLSNWGERQFTYCSGFAKGLPFFNMVMTFVLHPLSHYNSITEPRARFLLSHLDDLPIDFPSYFITSIIDVYQDMVTHDKLIFPSAITQILRHFSIPIPDSPHYTVMGAISIASIRWSKAQLRQKQPRTKSTDPAASTVPSTSAPSSSDGGMTLETIMMQF